MKTKLDNLLKKAYAKYSGIQVSAIAIDEKGIEYKGVNVENAAYPSGMCAERNAIFHAVAQGEKPLDIKEIHIGSNLKTKILYPCAGCLQVMIEFMPKNGKIFLYHDENIVVHTLKELVPYGVTRDSFEWK